MADLAWPCCGLASKVVVVFALLRPISAAAAPKPKASSGCAVLEEELESLESVDVAGCELFLSMSSDTFFSDSARSLMGPNSLSFQYEWHLS